MSYQASAYDIDDLFSTTQILTHNWRTMTKTDKRKHLDVYANKLKHDKDLTVNQYESLLSYLHECLDEKKLQKSSDIEFDKKNQCIIDIPRLVFKKNDNRFTLKHNDTRNKTVKRKTSNMITNDNIKIN